MTTIEAQRSRRAAVVARERRVGLPDQVAAQLGRRIVTGAIQPSDALPTETEIQAEFDVSRTAVREAIRLLSAKGLTQSRPRTGTRVRPSNLWNMLDTDVLRWHLEPEPTESFIRELFEMRLVFEPAATATAAERADADARRRLAEAMDGLAGNPPGSELQIEADLTFHMTILDATGNRLFRSLGSLIESALGVTFKLNWRSRTTSPEASVAMHRRVCELLLAGDGPLAADAMRVLIESSRNDALQAIARRGKNRKR